MKRDLLTAVAVLLVIVVICFGLGAMRPAFPATESHPFSMTEAGAVAEPKNVVMRVNGQPVSEDEFNQFIAAAPEQYRQYAAMPAARRAVAEQLVKMKVLEQEGKRLGVDADPLVSAQLAMDRTNIVANYALQKVVPPPSAAALRAEYEKQKQRFSALPLSHILISCEASPIPPRSGRKISCDEAGRKALALAGAIKSGTRFQDIARSESDDTASAANGGMIGNVTRGQLPPDVERTVFALQPGQVSMPVRTQYGVHIFEAGAPAAQTLEEVKPALEQSMRQRQVEEKLNAMRKAAKVDYDPKFFGPPPTGMAAPGMTR